MPANGVGIDLTLITLQLVGSHSRRHSRRA